MDVKYAMVIVMLLLGLVAVIGLIGVVSPYTMWRLRIASYARRESHEPSAIGLAHTRVVSGVALVVVLGTLVWLAGVVIE